MSRADELCGLLRHCEEAETPKRSIDLAIVRTFLVPWADYTSDLNAAIGLVNAVLPGWSWRLMSCSVSDDAWVEPDFNHPVHGERLKREFNQDTDWVAITDVDRRPPGLPAIALIEAMLRALSRPHQTEGTSDA